MLNVILPGGLPISGDGSLIAGIGESGAPTGYIDRDCATAGIATPAQIALAWLLDLAPNILLIPGTRTRTHLLENVAAATVELDAAVRTELDGASPATGPQRPRPRPTTACSHRHGLGLRQDSSDRLGRVGLAAGNADRRPPRYWTCSDASISTPPSLQSKVPKKGPSPTEKPWATIS